LGWIGFHHILLDSPRASLDAKFLEESKSGGSVSLKLKVMEGNPCSNRKPLKQSELVEVGAVIFRQLLKLCTTIRVTFAAGWAHEKRRGFGFGFACTHE
jgi:hypothetical protein